MSRTHTLRPPLFLQFLLMCPNAPQAWHNYVLSGNVLCNYVCPSNSTSVGTKTNPASGVPKSSITFQGYEPGPSTRSSECVSSAISSISFQGFEPGPSARSSECIPYTTSGGALNPFSLADNIADSSSMAASMHTDNKAPWPSQWSVFVHYLILAQNMPWQGG